MKKLTPKQKELLKQFIGMHCEECLLKKDSKELQIHRIHRGQEYSLRNIKIICNSCHRLYHYCEVFR